MFTGIVEKIGSVSALQDQGGGRRIEVETGFPDLAFGESVALDGVCLTVAALAPEGRASFDVSPETMARSSVSALIMGSKVNLERAMPASGRFSGHIVQGHVDGVGVVESWFEHPDGSRSLRVQVPRALSRYCVEKGSVAVQGVSLTINRLADECLEIMIVPHTWTHTSFSHLGVGAKVNLEADIIAKYVEKLCR